MSLVIASGCQIVPKEDPTGDEFSWRLSFSRGELLLSSHVPQKARDAYVAVKLFWKNNLKAECPALRSYHLKTLFYNFLEVTDNREMEMMEVKDIVKNLLLFIQLSLKSKTCKHYFIETINLFDSLSSTNDTFTSEQINTCINMVDSSVKTHTVLSKLLSRKSRTEMAISYCRDNNTILYVLLFFIVLLLNTAGIYGGAFVYITFILFILSQLISFLYASLILLPSLLLLFGLSQAIKYFVNKYRK